MCLIVSQSDGISCSTQQLLIGLNGAEGVKINDYEQSSSEFFLETSVLLM